MTKHLDPEAVRRLEAGGQFHLVEHARTLGPEAAAAFLKDVAAHPWEELGTALADPVLRPPQALTHRRQEAEGGIRGRLARQGEALIAGGRVATLLLAGGQGSRLGFDGPKGELVLGPGDDRSLYAIQAERVGAASRRAGRPVPLIVLVSEATEAATRAAFERGRAAWGLVEGQVRFLCQRRLPAFDADGRALLEAPGRLALAPDGHGGALGALVRSGLLDELAQRGVDVLTTYQVDNPLALPLDPVMLGWMVERHAQVVGKAVKRLPGEKVGVYARTVRGNHLIVEYSEFPDGGMPESLTMGSIALHGYGVQWLKGLFDGGYALPYHRAFKTVPHLGEDGAVVRPESPNAYKLEQFIFDVIPEAERVEVHEVARAREFAPVKNAAGADSPETARVLVAAEVARWYAAAGRPPPEPLALSPLDMERAAGN